MTKLTKLCYESAGGECGKLTAIIITASEMFKFTSKQNGVCVCVCVSMHTSTYIYICLIWEVRGVHLKISFFPERQTEAEAILFFNSVFHSDSQRQAELVWGRGSPLFSYMEIPEPQNTPNSPPTHHHHHHHHQYPSSCPNSDNRFIMHLIVKWGIFCLLSEA